MNREKKNKKIAQIGRKNANYVLILRKNRGMINIIAEVCNHR